MTIHRNTAAECERDITQLLIMTMMAEKIVSAPMMHFLKTGTLLRDSYFDQLMTDVGIKSMLGNDIQRYMLILAYHAFGAGAYMCAKDAEGCNIEDIRCASAQAIRADLVKCGSVELGLKVMNIDPQSNNKKVLDRLMLSSMDSIMRKYKMELQTDREYVSALLRVFFNVGVTVAIQRNV